MSAQKRSSEDIAEQEKRAKKDDWITDLEEKGYAVVPGVLTIEECEAALAQLKSYVAGLGRDMDERNDLSNIHGIYQHYGVGHSQAIWNIRTNSAVARPFEEIYGTNDLLVSFDGFCLMLPERRFQSGKTWFHMDQASLASKAQEAAAHAEVAKMRNISLKDANREYEKVLNTLVSGRQCIQGYVNLYDSSTDATGSLYVLPGSHLKFGEFFDKFPEMRGKKDWCKLMTPEQHAFFGVAPVRVHGPRLDGAMGFAHRASEHWSRQQACVAALRRLHVLSAARLVHREEFGEETEGVH